MSYPSIISQPGSAARNLGPVLDVLNPLLSRATAPSSSSKRKVLELASYPYEHIRAFSEVWKDVEWWGTGRDEGEVAAINGGFETEGKNLRPAHRLDISVEEDWRQLLSAVKQESTGPFEGVVMLNLVHCCPEGLPEEVFKHLSPMTTDGRAVLDPINGWIAAYGPYKNDDGSYRSDGDAKFDAEWIRSKHDSLGLRTPASISAMAERWGFVEEAKVDMPKGNLWIMWRVKSTER